MSHSQIKDTDFEPIHYDDSDAEKIAGESTSFWKDAWRRFKQNKLAILGIIVIVFLAVMSITGTMISGHNYSDNRLLDANQSPSLEHLIGTDKLGRDIFASTWYEARLSLFIGQTAAYIDLIKGVFWVTVSGYLGGKVDDYMMRIADVLSGVPYLLVVILLMVIMPQGLWTLIIAMTITGWIGMARIVRGEVLKLKSEEFILASKSLGASTVRI